MSPAFKRRIAISLLSGIGITLALIFLDYLAFPLVSYRGLFFEVAEVALFPGFVLGGLFSGPGWMAVAVFFVTNSAAYALLVFCTATIIRNFQDLRRWDEERENSSGQCAKEDDLELTGNPSATTPE
jgi:hypothetical protein